MGDQAAEHNGSAPVKGGVPLFPVNAGVINPQKVLRKVSPKEPPILPRTRIRTSTIATSSPMTAGGVAIDADSDCAPSPPTRPAPARPTTISSAAASSPPIWSEESSPRPVSVGRGPPQRKPPAPPPMKRSTSQTDASQHANMENHITDVAAVPTREATAANSPSKPRGKRYSDGSLNEADGSEETTTSAEHKLEASMPSAPPQRPSKSPPPVPSKPLYRNISTSSIQYLDTTEQPLASPPTSQRPVPSTQPPARPVRPPRATATPGTLAAKPAASDSDTPPPEQPDGSAPRKPPPPVPPPKAIRTYAMLPQAVIVESEGVVTTGEALPVSPPRDDEELDHRTRIVREIVDTERAYVHNLESMVRCYMQPLLAQAAAERAFDEADIRTMFSNVMQLIPLNQALLRSLHERVVEQWSPTQKIGDVFLQMAPFLKMYKDYGANYETALQLYNNYMEKNKAFAAAIGHCDETRDTVVRLEGLLIMPIQRIPRYNLLLLDLKKHTPPTHPDYDDIAKAQAKLEEIGDYLDKSIAEAENRKKFLDLSAQGATALLAPHRTLIREGVLACLSPSKDKYHLWVFSDIVVHLPEHKAKKKANLTAPENQWPLRLVWLPSSSPPPPSGAAAAGSAAPPPSAAEGEPDSFALQGPTGRYVFKCGSAKEKEAWVADLSAAVKTQMDNLLEGPSEGQTAELRWARFSFPDYMGGGFYVGWWKNGVMHGKGTLTLPHCLYEGEFHEGQRGGTGTQRYANGDVYEGEWAHDRQSGHGRLTSRGGDLYDGGWAEGRRSGYGQQWYGNGVTYYGDWKHDLPEGHGTLVYPGSNGRYYTGEWVAGRPHGTGTMVYTNGAIYTGQWDSGQREGKGTMTYPDGSKYEGDWHLGKRHGQGTLVTTYAATYTGEWEWDLFDGRGTIRYADGSTYTGQWKRGVYHGSGVLSEAEGTGGGAGLLRYEGTFQDGLRHGKGVQCYRNGCRYEGQFRADRPHGNGVLLLTDGSRLEGKWLNGAPEGKCTFGKGDGEAAALSSGNYEGNTLVASAAGWPIPLPPDVALFPLELEDLPM